MENDDLLHAKDGGIERLLYIMRRLRDPDTGCPWDIEQSFSSIAPYTIEEAYEVADAIARRDMADLKAELGSSAANRLPYSNRRGGRAFHLPQRRRCNQ